MLDGARGAIDFYKQALGTEEISEGDRWFERAVAAGCTVMMPALFGFGAIASAWSKILSAFVGDLERRRHDSISGPSARQ